MTMGAAAANTVAAAAILLATAGTVNPYVYAGCARGGGLRGCLQGLNG